MSPLFVLFKFNSISDLFRCCFLLSFSIFSVGACVFVHSSKYECCHSCAFLPGNFSFSTRLTFFRFKLISFTVFTFSPLSRSIGLSWARCNSTSLFDAFTIWLINQPMMTVISMEFGSVFKNCWSAACDFNRSSIDRIRQFTSIDFNWNYDKFLLFFVVFISFFLSYCFYYSLQTKWKMEFLLGRLFVVAWPFLMQDKFDSKFINSLINWCVNGTFLAHLLAGAVLCRSCDTKPI